MDKLESINSIARKLFEKYSNVYDPTILKKSELIELLNSLELKIEEKEKIISNDEILLNLIFTWSNIIFKEKFE